jgi:hypothetical protein
MSLKIDKLLIYKVNANYQKHFEQFVDLPGERKFLVFYKEFG